jgi:hypothetical protein
MAAKTEEKPRWLQAREAVCVIVGARAPVYETAIVKDRHTGRLAEVPLTEYPPADPGSLGMTYVFRRGERVLSDHPAVLESPGSFVEAVDELVLAERK